MKVIVLINSSIIEKQLKKYKIYYYIRLLMTNQHTYGMYIELISITSEYEYVNYIVKTTLETVTNMKQLEFILWDIILQDF